MELKDLIALPLLALATFAGILLASFSQRLRDAAFFLMVFGTAITERLDVNFLSRYWYRGTSRGFEFTFVDVLAISILAASFFVPRYGARRWYWPAGLAFMGLYALYAIFSVTISVPKIYGLFELTKIFRGIVIFLAAAMYVRTRRELMILVAALGCIVFIEGLDVAKQHIFGGMTRVPGTLDHPNSLSMYTCLIAPLLVAAINTDTPRWLRWFCSVALPVAALTVVLTFSRAGVPIFAFVTLGAAIWCTSWRITWSKFATVALIALGVAIVAGTAWDKLKTRYEDNPLDEEYADTGEGRGVYLRWARLIVDEHFFGVGLNNWSYWVSKKYGTELGFNYEDYDILGPGPYPNNIRPMRSAAPAHSLAALTVGELGIPGLVIFSVVWLRWFQMGASFLWRRFTGDPLYAWGVGLFFGGCAVFLQSITEWTYRHTQIFLLFNIMLGALASLYTLRGRVVPQASCDEEPEPDSEPADNVLMLDQPETLVVESW